MRRPSGRGLAALVIGLGLAGPVYAHGLNVFASTDCEAVLVEAKFSNGRRPVSGEVRILDGENTLLATGTLTEDGTLSVPMSDLSSTTGLLVEVTAAGHDDYWIMTPEDLAKKCQS